MLMYVIMYHLYGDISYNLLYCNKGLNHIVNRLRLLNRLLNGSLSSDSLLLKYTSAFTILIHINWVIALAELKPLTLDASNTRKRYITIEFCFVNITSIINQLSLSNNKKDQIYNPSLLSLD